MNCPKCGTKMEAQVELTGGCHGHCGEDDRCYCDSPDCHVEFSCPNFGAAWRDTAKGRKWKRGSCKQSPVRAESLTDSGSIGKFITEHYDLMEKLAVNHA